MLFSRHPEPDAAFDGRAVLWEVSSLWEIEQAQTRKHEHRRRSGFTTVCSQLGNP